MSAIFPWAFWKEGGFSPASFEGLNVWLDATDSNQVLFYAIPSGEDDVVVTGWLDKSPANNNFHQDISSNWGMYNEGGSGIRFLSDTGFMWHIGPNGSGNPLAINDNDGFHDVTMYIVLEADPSMTSDGLNHGSWGDFYGDGDTDFGTDRQDSHVGGQPLPDASLYPWDTDDVSPGDLTIYENFGRGGQNESVSDLLDGADRQNFDIGNTVFQKHIYSIRKDTTTPEWKAKVLSGVNNTIFTHTASTALSKSAGTAGSGFFTGVAQIGSAQQGFGIRRFFKGVIYELIIYSGALNGSQQIRLENYLLTKHGFTTLPE